MNEAPQSLEERAAELEQKLNELHASTNARIIRSELKAEAVKAGMVDLDGLKLIDTAALALNETGEVEGAATLMRDLRKGKPWLFSSPSSSSAAAAPPVQPTEMKRATQMTHDEWLAAKAELIKRK